MRRMTRKNCTTEAVTEAEEVLIKDKAIRTSAQRTTSNMDVWLAVGELKMRRRTSTTPMKPNTRM